MKNHKRVIAMTDDGEAITQQDIAPTILPDAYLTSDIAQKLVGFHLPRYAELPTVSLYRDQVIGIVEQALRSPTCQTTGNSALSQSPRFGCHSRLKFSLSVAHLIEETVRGDSAKEVLNPKRFPRLYKLRDVYHLVWRLATGFLE